MRASERGIGNLAFIAVLVLLLIAIALYFVRQSEADDLKTTIADQAEQLRSTDKTINDAKEAYDALYATLGSNIAELQRKDTTYPTPKVINDKVADWLWAAAEAAREASKTTIAGKVYTPNPETNEVKVSPGDPKEVTLFATAFTKETMTVRNLLDPLPAQFRFAAKTIKEAVDGYESKVADAETRLTALNEKINQVTSKYTSDVGAKGTQADNFKQEADNVRDQNNNLIATNDNLQSSLSTVKAEADKKVRTADRERNAWKNRAIAEKKKKELQLAEDPKDGEVLVADNRKGLVFINLGTSSRVSPGTKFVVWRAGKGNVREDVAVVRVFSVDKTKSTARILALMNPRVPVTAGMNVSNPFYDPKGKLKVYIWGDLKTYPTAVAKRRLAESGCMIAPELDDTVNVIVLGEPPVTAGEEPEDEAEAALAARRMSMNRAKNLREIREIATSIGAVVVTEKVLATFINY